MTLKNKYKDNLPNLIFSFILVLIVSLSFSRFLMFVESRPGSLLADPVLALFEPIDLTYYTFGILYGALIMAILSVVKDPASLALAMKAYAIMLLIRAVLMYVTPLEAPEKLIVLEDPFVKLFSDGVALRRDLFFSGHTSTMFLLFLAVKSKLLKALLLMGTVAVGACVILQHVHYCVDVAVAPLAAFAAWKIAGKIWGGKENGKK